MSSKVGGIARAPVWGTNPFLIIILVTKIIIVSEIRVVTTSVPAPESNNRANEFSQTTVSNAPLESIGAAEYFQSPNSVHSHLTRVSTVGRPSVKLDGLYKRGGRLL